MSRKMSRKTMVKRIASSGLAIVLSFGAMCSVLAAEPVYSETVTVTLPFNALGLLANVKDTNTALAAISAAAAALADEDKAQPAVVDGMVQFAEEALAAGCVLAVPGTDYTADAADIAALCESAVAASAEATDILLAAGVVPERKIAAKAVIKSLTEGMLTCRFKNIAPTADYIQIEIRKAAIAVPAAVFEQANKGSDGFYVRLAQTSDNTVEYDLGIANPAARAKLYLPADASKSREMAVFDKDGGVVSSRYNPFVGKLTLRVTDAGALAVQNNAKAPKDTAHLPLEAQNAINVLYTKGIVFGYGPDAFYPDSLVSRGEFAAMLVRLLGVSPQGVNHRYADMIVGSRYTAEAALLQSMGLMSGYADNTFRPDAPISKVEMTACLSRALLLETGRKTGNAAAVAEGFTDIAAIPAWAKTDVGVAEQYGLVIRNDDGSFGPDQMMNRADTAVMIKRLYDKIW